MVKDKMNGLFHGKEIGDYMEHYQKEYVTQEKEVLKQITCDCCNSVIKDEGKYISKHHFTITTGYNDWGNDSFESRKNEDVCSTNCLNEKFIYYMNLVNKTDGTEYIEVEKER